MGFYPKDIYSAIKTTLSGSSELTYVDTVVIAKYTPENLPDFTSYCIVISPVSARSVIYPPQQRYIHTFVQLCLLGKIGDRTEEDAIIADSPPTNVGIATMYEDVYRTLYYNNLGDVIELLPRVSELDTDTAFNVLEEDRDTFIMEARMMYQPRGKRWVGNSAP